MIRSHSAQTSHKFISVLEWSRIHGISKAWACRLCVAGRVDGAVFEGGRWRIPEGTPLPDRKVSERILAAHSRAVERAGRVEAAKIDALDDHLRGYITDFVGEGWTFDRVGNGFFEGKAYIPPPDWNDAAWAFYQSLKADK